jgi:hypothetical protein
LAGYPSGKIPAVRATTGTERPQEVLIQGTLPKETLLDQEDIKGSFQDITVELPVLDDRFRRLLNLFKDGGVKGIEGFVKQVVTGAKESYQILESAIVLMKDLKHRANFEVYLKQFMQSMDIIPSDCRWGRPPRVRTAAIQPNPWGAAHEKAPPIQQGRSCESKACTQTTNAQFSLLTSAITTEPTARASAIWDCTLTYHSYKYRNNQSHCV